MSDVTRNISENARSGKVSPERARRFHETQQRMQASRAPSLQDVHNLAPGEGQVLKIAQSFALDMGDMDELVGLGSNTVRDQYDALRPVLVSMYRGEENFTALKMHLDRLVDAQVRSAYGAANFYESRRMIAKDAKDSDDRDADRMGIDGGDNRLDMLRRIAAEHAVKAHALACIATGACAAYRELMGEDWQPYQPNRGNARTLDQQAAAAADDALGI